MKRVLTLSSVTFVIIVATIFSIRASSDALAVTLGVVLGVAASIPTTFMVTYLLTRPSSNQSSASPSPLGFQPPVVVINASDKPSVAAPPTLPSLAAAPPDRRWTVIGISNSAVSD